MIKEDKLKVELLGYTSDPEQNVVAAIRQCYASVGAKELKEKTTDEVKRRLIKQVINSGHTSTLEHASFTFAIDGVSRVTEIHLIRHRIASFSIQSGRYVKRGDAAYRVPPKIRNLADKKLLEKYLKHLENSQELYNELIDAGIPAEDARFCQPQSVQVKIVMTMNARELLHFFSVRSCTRAQWEIREVAKQMLDLVKGVAPIIFENAGPPCVSEKICDQGKMSCGIWKNIKGAKLKDEN
ncbi:MAG: FAD-dependent thymidylate synthase [Candidatus Shapirobacteria bacterium]|nr:FAD-dependent thymidylate synthase [Candidatus Shapirobacteria bacterium]